MLVEYEEFNIFRIWLSDKKKDSTTLRCYVQQRININWQS